MEISEEKRKELISQLDRLSKRAFEYLRFLGAGFIKKIMRMISSPRIFFENIFWRLRVKISGCKSEIPVTFFFGRKILLDIRDRDALDLKLFGLLPADEECSLTKYFIMNLKSNDVFYDIGANWGFYSYLAVIFCNEVHVFEPLPNIAKLLEKNLSGDAKVTFNNIAISDKKGSSEIYISESSGRSTINKESVEMNGGKNMGKIIIQTTTLDEYVLGKNLPTIIKMDVEGAEYMVIKGGIDIFSKHNPIIALEVWSSSFGGSISMKAVELLREMGYTSYRITDKSTLEGIKGDLSLSIGQGRNCENFIFKK